MPERRGFHARARARAAIPGVAGQVGDGLSVGVEAREIHGDADLEEPPESGQKGSRRGAAPLRGTDVATVLPVCDRPDLPLRASQGRVGADLQEDAVSVELKERRRGLCESDGRDQIGEPVPPELRLITCYPTIFDNFPISGSLSWGFARLNLMEWG